MASVAAHAAAILAAGTHPTAFWTRSQQTPKERYDAVMDDLQMIGQRNMPGGLHVHVELPDPDDRVDVMCRMLPYLPLFVALATSSPFWQTRLTGLKGYRLAAYDELPRTGVPELFRRREDYEVYVEALVRAGVMEDSSYIWWAVRPSLKHATLELRAPDSCTRIDDLLAIAALYRSLARRLTRNPWLNWDLTAVDRAIVVENKWRAQRYGVHGTFVGIGGNGAISVADMVEQVIAQVQEDAAALGCLNEVLHCRAIVGEGTWPTPSSPFFTRHRSAPTTAAPPCAPSPTGSPTRRCSEAMAPAAAPLFTQNEGPCRRSGNRRRLAPREGEDIGVRTERRRVLCRGGAVKPLAAGFAGIAGRAARTAVARRSPGSRGRGRSGRCRGDRPCRGRCSSAGRCGRTWTRAPPLSGAVMVLLVADETSLVFDLRQTRSRLLGGGSGYSGTAGPACSSRFS